MGNTLFAWTAGYNLAERDKSYRQMFEERDANILLRILHKNNIAYVAIDDGVRGNDQVKKLNESVYKEYFEKVYEDNEQRTDNVTIYKVPLCECDIKSQSAPDLLRGKSTFVGAGSGISTDNVFDGRSGKDYGQFDTPRGITADAADNLYVADTGNACVQKFSPEGNFIAAFGKRGRGDGELLEPNGITVDSAGNIYVADANKHRLIKFKTDGTFEKQWSGPTPGFYGPRDVAIGTSGQIYVLDQGRNRVVRLDPESENTSEWGHNGAGEGEFSDPTGITVAGDRVFVADVGNNRIQAFDLDGKFIRQLDTPEWDKNIPHYRDVVFDGQANSLYATSGMTNEVLVFDADGNRLETLKPAAPDSLDNPSSLVLADTKEGKRLYVLNTGGKGVTQIKLAKQSERNRRNASYADK